MEMTMQKQQQKKPRNFVTKSGPQFKIERGDFMSIKPVLNMGRDELLKLDPLVYRGKYDKREILHVFTELGAFWRYDYEAADQGRMGLHALLKSELHSDGFLYSMAALQHGNICKIMARNLVAMWKGSGLKNPDWVAGVPDGATQLGKDFAQFLRVKAAEMVKEEGKIQLVSDINPGETLLLVEDFCTRGTGFKEAVRDILSKQPDASILPIELVIINRGGLKEIDIEEVGKFKVVAAAEHRINDWPEEDCPLCKKGSKPIKPKATDENWERIMTSQSK
jgi:orotate phosphoribosyltransferase